ncbi:hypothetical protein BS17DRAFT_698806, partial [Gyrodon lividus]
IAYKIIRSTTIILPAWQIILCNLWMTVSLMPCDVVTHWNKTFDMLEYAWKHREAVDTVIQCSDLGLRRFKLTNHKWKFVKQLYSILKDTTLFFSWSTPNLTTMIPAMDHIDKYLTMYLCNRSYSPAICTAVPLTMSTLNCYYSLTNGSEVYCIAMGMFELQLSETSVLTNHLIYLQYFIPATSWHTVKSGFNPRIPR